jgi:hypothetical protein
MMARSNELQSEAGYIYARPFSQLDKPSCDAPAGPYMGVKFAIAPSVCFRSASAGPRSVDGEFVPRTDLSE